jgi:hypothetical protein
VGKAPRHWGIRGCYAMEAICSCYVIGKLLLACIKCEIATYICGNRQYQQQHRDDHGRQARSLLFHNANKAGCRVVGQFDRPESKRLARIIRPRE